ncbi:MAG: thiamine phosphate synthase [Chloroflexi bacterium]|nr:thiamine phosphate synthase [Chloroflexota bacterium]
MFGLPGRPVLALVTDLDLVPKWDELIERTISAVRGGVDLVQVRARSLNNDEQIRLTSEVVNGIGRHARVVVNGDPEVALSGGANGVHLPENGISVSSVRSVLGKKALIGKSVHSAGAAVQAEQDGADYLFFGTVFPSRSHPGGQLSGIAGVAEAVSAVSIPVIGIGGITANNCKSVIDVGASGIAAISAIIGESDSYRATRAIRKALAARYFRLAL